jgi:hypothetical protein
VESLLDRFRPTDLMSQIEAKTELSELKFKKKVDPDEYFNAIEAIRSKYGGSRSEVLTNADVISTAISQAPREYSPVISALVHQSKANQEQMELYDLNSAMREHWRIRYSYLQSEFGNDSDDESDDGKRGKEKLMQAVDQSYHCYNCGESSHKGYQCPKPKQGNGDKYKPVAMKRFNGNRNNCGKLNHKQ